MGLGLGTGIPLDLKSKNSVFVSSSIYRATLRIVSIYPDNYHLPLYSLRGAGKVEMGVMVISNFNCFLELVVFFVCVFFPYIPHF